MKKLELVQMENLEGGKRCSGSADAQAQILIMTTAGTMFGPLGALGFGLFAIYATNGGSHCM